MARVSGHTGEAIRIDGLAEFRQRLKDLNDPGSTEQFKQANFDVAQSVVSRARFLADAQGPIGSKAAKTLRATRNAKWAQINLGGSRAPYAWGAEFGAYRNKLRLKKNTGGKAYIVRKNSKRQIAKAIARIESQTRLRHETISKRQAQRDGGTKVKVTGQVIGWNQFKEWRGNKEGAGYFLFPTIRAMEAEIRESYGAAIDDLAAKAFPEST